MTIFQQGQLNLTALTVAGVYTQIVQPPATIINGVPTNILGVVGTATWGPKNTAVNCSPAQLPSYFGPMQARKYDLGTAVNAAASQGANNVVGVRVTDGTDTAASGTITASGTAITFTALYSGTLGNGIVITPTNGNAAGSYAVTVAVPGLTPETFTNVTGTGNAFWVNLAAAINAGQSGFRGPSKIVVATAGAGTGSPTVGSSVTLSGGTDGVATITTATLVGVNTLGAPKGMYCLTGQGCSVGLLADSDDSTQWTYQLAFGLSAGIEMVTTTPLGDNVTSAATAKATAGIDGYGLKIMLGDWCLIQDQVNNVQRYIPQSGFVAGLLSALSPQNSPLNKALTGFIGTQRSAAGTAYSDAEIQALVAAGIDVISNPAPGGASYFACRTGHNASSNLAIWGDNYTRMTNYIATSINAFVGQFLGKTNTPQLRANLKAAADTFFLNMQTAGQIADWSSQCDEPTKVGTNNPQNRIAQGYLQLDLTIQYLSIVEKLIVNIQGGQTVTITRASTTQLAA